MTYLSLGAFFRFLGYHYGWRRQIVLDYQGSHRHFEVYLQQMKLLS